MARINFEDDVESQHEFWELLRIVGGNRAEALGRLLLFFRDAQRAFGHDEPITVEDAEKRFPEMIQSGWAVAVPGGYQAKGAAKHFDWYRQKVSAGKRGGRPVSETNRTVSAANRTVRPANPLALSPAPVLSPAPAQKRERENAPIESGGVDRCKLAWASTLTHFGASKPLAPSEELALGRAVQRWGADAVELALIGKRFEPKDERYDPGKNLSLSKLLDPRDPSKFERAHALGAQARNKEASRLEYDRMLAEMRAGITQEVGA